MKKYSLIFLSFGLLNIFTFTGCGISDGPSLLSSNSGSSSASYTVTYNSNSSTFGAAPVDSTSYTQGSSVSVLGNTGALALQKTGWAFAGWNTASDGTGTTYLPNSTFSMGNSNVTLYARWMRRRIFVSDATPNGGNLKGSEATGIAGADKLCQNDPKRTSLGIITAKAMIVDGNTRVACVTDNCTGAGISENIDWVLAPNMAYINEDGLDLGTTNQNGIFLLDNNAINTNNKLLNSINNSAQTVWTGFDINWITDPNSLCTLFTNEPWTSTAVHASFSNYGACGQANQKNWNVYAGTGTDCDVQDVRLYCVEQ